jgi:hypothetical protein
MTTIARVLGLTLLLATALFAAAPFADNGVTGKWSGTFIVSMDGETKDDTAYMELTQTGTELTGTAGPNAEQQMPIQKGKVEGNKLTFEVQTGGPLIKFELTLVEGHLKGQAKAEQDGRTMSAVVDVQRKTE